MMSKAMVRLALGAFLVAGAAACDSTGPTRTGEVTVALSTSGAFGTLAYGDVDVTLESGATGNVSLSIVESILVTVTRVDVMGPTGDEEGTRGWVSLNLVTPAPFNLLQLPSELGDGMLLARGELEAGAYSNVRLFVENATITFSSDVTIGGGPQARTYAAGEPHALRIPSATQTGVKIPMAGFTISEDEAADVVLVFDPAASVQTVNATQSFIIMSPVLNVKSED
jgi:hypothetical protein